MEELGELQEVVPVGTFQEVDAIRIYLVSLEVYETGTLLHLHVRLRGQREFPLGQFKGPRGPELKISVADEQGEYSRDNYMMAGGSRHEWRYSYVLVPPLRRSRALSVNVAEISLILVDSSGKDRQERWPGPWEFTVTRKGA